MFLICGLGNPGPEYHITRHNIGFLFIDYLANRLEISQTDLKQKYKGIFTQAKLAENNVILLKPLTYMNNSGVSAYEIAKFYKIPSKNIIAIHDDLDLKFSDVRTKFSGGHAGHNGLKSLDKYVSNKYHRIRIGIGHPRDSKTPQMSPSDYVLQNFSLEEQNNIPDILAKSEQHLLKIMELS